MKSTLQQCVDKSWHTIAKLVAEEVGKPEDRTLRRVARVKDVDAATRVVLGESTASDEQHSSLGGGRLVRISYRSDPVPLHHRRYAFNLSLDELERVSSVPPEGEQVRQRVREWARAVVAHEAAVVVGQLTASAGGEVQGPLDARLVEAVRARMRENGYPDADGPLCLVCAGEVSADAKKALQAALRGGDIVELPPKARLSDRTLAVVFHPGRESMVVYQAVELALGWNTSPTGVELLLDQRSSDIINVPPRPARVRLIARVE